MLVEDMVWPQSCNHAKVTKLSDVKEGRQRQTATKEVHHWVWSCKIQLLEPLEILFVVLIENVSLCLAKNRRSQATEKNRRSIEKFNKESSSWIAPMCPCKASW